MTWLLILSDGSHVHRLPICPRTRYVQLPSFYGSATFLAYIWIQPEGEVSNTTSQEPPVAARSRREQEGRQSGWDPLTMGEPVYREYIVTIFIQT